MRFCSRVSTAAVKAKLTQLELAAETSSPAAHVQVHLALDAAKRLAAECDRQQTSNLGLPTRSRDSSSSGSKRIRA